MEPIAPALASSIDPDLSMHFSRLAGSQFEVVPDSDSASLEAAVTHAASLLADARVQAIGWYGSTLKMEVDRELCERLEVELRCPIATTLMALSEGLHELGVERYSLVSSSPVDVRALIVSALEQEGFACVRASASIDERLLTEAARHDASLLVVVETGMESNRAIEAFEEETGAPVVDSRVATTWRALRLAGVATASVTGWGRLLGES
jgi:maleate isomerase